MLVDVKCNAICNIDINTGESFELLCKVLNMNFVLDEDTKYFIKKNEYDENAVYVLDNGKEKCIDDRGDLFVALRNVAVNIFPNTAFRSDDYIYK